MCSALFIDESKLILFVNNSHNILSGESFLEFLSMEYNRQLKSLGTITVIVSTSQ